LIAIIQALYGCAAPYVKPIETPTGRIGHGDPLPLIDQVRSGAIGINDWQAAYVYESVKGYPTLISIGWTPICAAIHADDIDSVSTLLQLGASVSQPCGMKDDEKNSNPLEFSMWLQALKPKAEQIARLLITKGAVTRTGKVSEADFKNSNIQNLERLKNIEDYSDSLYAKMAKETQQKKEAKEAAEKEKFFNKDTVMGLVAIAGATANNYVALKNNTPPVQSLNNLLAQTTTPKVERVTANSAQAKQSNPSSTKVTTAASSSTNLSSPAVQQSAQISGGLDSKKLYTYRVNSHFRGIGETEAAGCKAAEKDAEDWSPTVLDDKRKLLSRGSCSCTSGYSNFFGKALECTIPYKMEITSPNNPNTNYTVPSTAVSK